ncbi:hypothetical protein JCM19037_2897 [Geomicrobium sp. JCM 19037]|uniref:DUF4339 domain-containing protein n=1 Tax=Geomicrobium sp. JCM 19037 TaxID=1460634 RepID=UPI00045F43DC|nr:DUF4339 domain-containing protein [Geomicrobium sp. JCM 19037]GAK04476.1 hypothetical protein JCM19037_2897 [Geomicrobium sp. JCM 19037]
MKQEWYYLVDDGNQIGPFSAKMMVQLYEDEKIHKETYVWDGIIDGWRYFSRTQLYEQWKSYSMRHERTTLQEPVTRMHKWEEVIEKRVLRKQFFAKIFTIHSWQETNDVLFAHHPVQKPVQPWVYTRVMLLSIFFYLLAFTLSFFVANNPLFIPFAIAGLLLPGLLWIVFLLEIQRHVQLLPIIYTVIVILSGVVAMVGYATVAITGISFILLVFLIGSVALYMRLYKHQDLPHALFIGALIAVPYAIIEGRCS